MTITASFPSVIPSLLLDFANEQALDPRITFTRSTTGTYYNGYSSAVAEQNLFTYSQDWVNGYSVSGVTLTSTTATAPDSSATAATITGNAGLAVHSISHLAVSVGVGTYTISMYVKAGTTNFVTVGFLNNLGSYVSVTANLTTVAITQTASSGSLAYVSSSVTSVGSSWYRVVFTATASATLSCGLTNSPSISGTPTLTGNGGAYETLAGTETISLWGAQLEQRSAVTAYNATTTTAITNYIPVLQTGAINQARFDHNPTTGESLGLLIEQQSTNLLTYSQTFTNVAWTANNSNLTMLNVVVAPDGTLSGVVMNEGTTATAHYTGNFAGITTVSGTTYTFSSYFKNAGRQFVQILGGISGFGSNAFVNFDLVNGVVGTVGSAVTSSSITSVGNGWYRCTFSAPATASVADGLFVATIPSATSTRIPSYTGTLQGISIWGAQLEALAFPTSYIPTVASQVTRSADSASMTGTNFSSWYNISQGTLYAGFNCFVPLTATPPNKVVSFNPIALGSYLTLANYQSYTGGYNTNFPVGYIYTPNTNSKLSLSYNSTGVGSGTLSFNGATPVTLTPLDYKGTSTSLIIGNYGAGQYLNGWIQKIAYYPIAVSSANLIALTGS